MLYILISFLDARRQYFIYMLYILRSFRGERAQECVMYI